MNKRINLLLEQSGLQPYYDAQEGQIEKFAELIVKECINEIHDADVGNLKGRGYYLDKVAEHIENHFGVE
jgi:hypothetical protein